MTPDKREPTKTPWYPPHIKPVREGPYETRWESPEERPDHKQYQHWDGKQWSAWSTDPDGAAWNSGFRSKRQEPEWRGLASDPGAAK